MKIDIRDGLLILLFAALVSVSSVFIIPIVGGYLTFQIIFVLLSGAVLGPWLAAISMLIYVAVGLLGAPVFPGGGGGPIYALQPDFGYILSFIPAAWAVGMIYDLKPSPQLARWLLGIFALILIVFAGVITSQGIYGVSQNSDILLKNNGISSAYLYAPIIFVFLSFIYMIWVMYLKGSVAVKELSNTPTVLEPLWGGVAMLLGLLVVYMMKLLYTQYIDVFINARPINLFGLIWTAFKTFPWDIIQVIFAALLAREIVPRVREESW
ncbi:MAG: biotin transporter BioY [bacterium]